MDAEKLERLLLFECIGETSPELLLLRAYVEAEEAEKRRRDPKVISAEISKALEEACARALGTLRDRASFGCHEDIVSRRWIWGVSIAATTLPVFDDLSLAAVERTHAPWTPSDLVVRTRRIDYGRWEFAVSDIQDWRTEDGERLIRSLIAQVARALEQHIAAST